jgi:SAM-dependent methyltransferase
MNENNVAEALVNNSDIRRWNDSMALKYNPESYHKKSFFLIRLIERIRVRAVLRLLAAKDRERILDIGCGAGNIIENISKGRLFGVDLCKHLLMIASQKKYKAPLSLIQSFGEKLPFKSCVFDKVFCSEVIEHIKEPHLLVKEANRVLRKDGFFVISVPNENFINIVKMLLLWCSLDKVINSISNYKFAIDMLGEWHLHKFDLNLTRELVGNLFRIEKIRYIPFRIFPIHLIIVFKKKFPRDESSFN